jgi:hypothetical protein
VAPLLARGCEGLGCAGARYAGPLEQKDSLVTRQLEPVLTVVTQPLHALSHGHAPRRGQLPRARPPTRALRALGARGAGGERDRRVPPPGAWGQASSGDH